MYIFEFHISSHSKYRRKWYVFKEETTKSHHF